MTRREAREELFKWIFQTEIQGNSIEEAFEHFGTIPKRNGRTSRRSGRKN